MKDELPIKLLVLYSALFLACNLTDLTVDLTGIRVFFYSFVTFFEFILFSLFIRSLVKNHRFKRLILFAFPLFATFLVIHVLTENFVRIDSFSIGVETILILIFSFYYLFEQMNDPKVLFVYNYYHFWVVIGFMLYLSGSFFIYIFANQLPQDQVIKYWFFIDIFLILKNVFFALALLIFIFQQKNKTPQPYRTLNASF